MKYIGFLLISCWLLFNPLSAAAQVSVHFKARAEVSGQRIVLADIADIQPAGSATEALGQLPITSAPAPGRTKELYVTTVINGLRNRPEAADVDWQGSQTIVVERQAVTLSPEQMQAMIAAYLKENSSILPKAEIRFSSVRAPEAMVLPAGTLTWKITPSRPGIIGSTNFVIALSVDDKPAGNCTLRGRLEVTAEVLTAASTLHKGDFLTEENVVLQRQDISNIDNPLFVKEDFLGRQVARTVTTGSILKSDYIVLPPVIKDGEMVKIIARRGSLQLSTNGLARAEGRLGETIAVKNISSNKMIHGRVDGPGMVSVEF